MKKIFFVSVAIGIFSGTSFTVKAQPAVNMERINTALPEKQISKFIDGIEIYAGNDLAEKNLPLKTFLKQTNLPATAVVSDIENYTVVQFKYAQLLDVDVESITNKLLFNEIEKWWGTHYRYGGATAKGIDCSAYTGSLVHAVFGLVLPRTSRDQYADCIKLEQDEMQQGDLVFFKTGRGVSHVGLYLGNGYFTHASTSIGVTISNLTDPYWSKKYIGGGRIKTPAVSDVE